MIAKLSIVVYAFARQMLTSLSVDKILLLRCVNWSTNFRSLPVTAEMAPCLKHTDCFIGIHVDANASCCLLQAMQ